MLDPIHTCTHILTRFGVIFSTYEEISSVTNFARAIYLFPVALMSSLRLKVKIYANV